MGDKDGEERLPSKPQRVGGSLGFWALSLGGRWHFLPSQDVLIPGPIVPGARASWSLQELGPHTPWGSENWDRSL